LTKKGGAAKTTAQRFSSSKGNMFISQKTADVVDERDVIANKENVTDGRIVMPQKTGTMNQDERFTAT